MPRTYREETGPGRGREDLRENRDGRQGEKA